MKTLKHTFFTLLVCLFVIWQGFSQHTEVEFDSGPTTPQLQLTETVDNDFTRLIFKNTGDLTQRWTLATRSGTSALDFGLYYNGGSRLYYNENTKSFSLSGVKQEIKYNSSGGDPNLLITETGSGASYGRLTFENQSPGYWTFAARHGTGTGDDDFNLYYDNGTTGYNIINVDGDNDKINLVSNVDVFKDLVVDENATVTQDLDVGGLASVDDLSVSEEASFSKGLISFNPIKIRESGQGTAGPEVIFLKENTTNTVAARIKLENGAGAGNDGDLMIKNENIVGSVIIGSEGSTNMRYQDTDNWSYQHLSPWSHETHDLGKTFKRWRTIYLQNNPNVGSDIRLKNTISELDETVLEKLMRLTPKTYRYNHQNDDDNLVYGFIAQDVKTVFPDLVLDPQTEEDFYSMNYDGLSAIAIKAIQQQQAIIEDLQKEMASLKKAISEK